MIVPISNFVGSKDNVRYKFEFTSGIGNNIYLDDINITSLTGIDEVDAERALVVYPNPVSDNLTIEFRDNQQQASQITISDLSGRLVYNKVLSASESSSILQVNVSKLSPGIYFLNVIDLEGRPLIKKIAVQ